jgi:hypothetical protein
MQGDFEWLEVAANIAAIITALVATFAYGRFLWERRNKRLRLETCLKNDQHQGGRSLLDLATTLGMTDSEIMDAAFRSKRIRRTATSELYGSPSKMLLEYDDNTSN